MRRLAAAALALAAFVPAARGETNVVGRARVDFAEEATLEVSAVPAVGHAEESRIEVDPVVPARRVDAHPGWYDRIEAERGSRAYWILYAAREKARRGEDTGALAVEFARTLSQWVSQ